MHSKVQECDYSLETCLYMIDFIYISNKATVID